MNSAEALTLTYLERAPESAADVLQSLPIEQSSSYLESVPGRLAAPVLNAMTAWYAARVLEGIPPSRAAMILRQLPFSDATSLTRLMQAERRDRALEELPTRQGRRLAASLRYPPHQVGAWIDPGVPTLSRSQTVEDALRALRAAEPASHVFVEGEHGEYLGVVALQDVLRSEASLTLGQLDVAYVKPISNRASLASVAFDARWDELLHLPVVGRRGDLLGGLSRATLRKGVHDERVERRVQTHSLVGEVFAALLLTCSGLSRLIAETTRTPDSGTPRGHTE